MEVEFGSDLIKELQISLRKEAGIPNYNPDDLRDDEDPSSSSLHEAIGRLDPSCPSYLRCKQCNGRLVRGIQSIVCIYCGSQQASQSQSQSQTPPPPPIPFKSTFGYRWLLQSLHLTGSEAIEASDSHKGNPSKDAMTLSDLLNIQLKCPIQDNAAHTANKPMKIPLNLAGVDLDNFFSDPHASPGQGSFIQPTQTFDSSGWEAEFQSAGVRTAPLPVPVNSTPLPFPHASPMVPSSPLEKASESEAEIKLRFDGMNQMDVLMPQASTSDTWTENDQSLLLNLEMKTKPDKDQHPTHDLNNLFPTNNNLFQDDLWLSSTAKHTEDESFDAWQDFTSSGNPSDPFPTSNPTNMLETSTNKLSPGKSLASSSNDVQDEFDSLMAPNLFLGTTNGHNGSTSVNDEQEGSYSDRLAEMISGDLESSENTNRDVDNTAETLMAQMNDLSFMLEGNLSVPEKHTENGVDLKS